VTVEHEESSTTEVTDNHSGVQVELIDESSNEDDEDDLRPYALPDSDDADSDDDPELVRRHKKVQTPVYILLFINGLFLTNTGIYVTFSDCLRRRRTMRPNG
jgi:telomere length regulation protein